MLRLPQEPDDSNYKPFGEKVVKTTTTATKPAKPYTDYTPIKGRPGWEDDGYGHQRYDAMADAARREREEEKRLARLAQPEVAALHDAMKADSVFSSDVLALLNRAKDDRWSVVTLTNGDFCVKWSDA